MFIESTTRQEMYILIRQVLEGEISIRSFCSCMGRCYCMCIDGFDADETEREVLGDISAEAFYSSDEYGAGWGRTTRELNADVLEAAGRAKERIQSSGHWQRQENARAAIRRAILDEWDPLDIKAFAEAPGEYEPFVEPLFLLLDRGAKRDEILEFLKKFEQEELGISSPRGQTSSFAVRLIALRSEGPFNLVVGDSKDVPYDSQQAERATRREQAALVNEYLQWKDDPYTLPRRRPNPGLIVARWRFLFLPADKALSALADVMLQHLRRIRGEFDAYFRYKYGDAAHGEKVYWKELEALDIVEQNIVDRKPLRVQLEPLWTDVIGYGPEETDKDFQELMDLEKHWNRLLKKRPIGGKPGGADNAD